MSENQKTKAFTWEELQNMERLFREQGSKPEGVRSTKKNLALYSLYTKIPPRRVQDYRIMKIGKDTDPTNFNYLDLEKSNLIFNLYKTSDKYGQYISNIPKDLEKILKEYIQEYNLEEGDFLFHSSTKNKHYETHSFSKVVSNAFQTIGKKIDVNAIRHAYATHVLSEKMSQNELEKIGKAMGTSRMELIETYNKLDL